MSREELNKLAKQIRSSIREDREIFRIETRERMENRRKQFMWFFVLNVIMALSGSITLGWVCLKVTQVIP